MDERYLDRNKRAPDYWMQEGCEWSYHKPPDGLSYHRAGIYGAFQEDEGAAFRSLAKQVENGRIAHVGTANGLSLSYIFAPCRKRNTIVYAIDYWYWPMLEVNLVLWGNTDTVVPVTASSVEASQLFPDKHFDLVFIDADHSYEAVREDLDSWLPKVRLGGYLCGHDYTPGFDGVIQAVDETFGRKKVGTASSFWWARKTVYLNRRLKAAKKAARSDTQLKEEGTDDDRRLSGQEQDNPG